MKKIPFLYSNLKKKHLKKIVRGGSLTAVCTRESDWNENIPDDMSFSQKIVELFLSLNFVVRSWYDCPMFTPLLWMLSVSNECIPSTSKKYVPGARATNDEPYAMLSVTLTKPESV